MNMPSRRLKFLKNTDYHVYSRGFLKMKIFRSDRDAVRFVKKLYVYSREFRIIVRRCAIMENHFHFLINTASTDRVSLFMKKLLQSHANYINIKYKRCGPVFDGRFKAKPATDREYLETLREYIANNPSKCFMSKPFDSIINSSFCGTGYHIRGKYYPDTKSPDNT